jgi:predicted transposase YbfD/YdcC
MNEIIDAIHRDLLVHFSIITDPRSDINKKHKLIDIIFIGIVAVLCGSEHWEEISDFARAKEKWFKKYLALPFGIPSHDRIRAVFVNLDPLELEKSFRNWVQSIMGNDSGTKIINIDGKTLRASRSDTKKKKPLHMVSAWAHGHNLVIGQVKTDEKSNEITAIPELLKALDLKGTIATIDAMGCQKEIAKIVTEKEGDYIIGLKTNQKELYKKAVEYFNSDQYEKQSLEEQEKTSHGRQEKRTYELLKFPGVNEKYTWSGLSSIGKVHCETLQDEKVKEETRYFITSLKISDIEKFAKGARSHWGIENSLHWQLDVSFGEDQCRKRAKNAAQNFSVIRKISLNMLKNDKIRSFGIKSKRKACCYDENYLETILLSA